MCNNNNSSFLSSPLSQLPRELWYDLFSEHDQDLDIESLGNLWTTLRSTNPENKINKIHEICLQILQVALSKSLLKFLVEEKMISINRAMHFISISSNQINAHSNLRKVTTLNLSLSISQDESGLPNFFENTNCQYLSKLILSINCNPIIPFDQTILPSLTNLNLKGNLVSWEQLQGLSNALEELTFNAQDIPKDDFSFPQNLRHLRLTIESSITTQLFKLFPTTLRSLTLVSAKFQSNIDFQLLPRELEKLAIKDYQNLPPSCFTKLPSSLKYLTLLTHGWANLQLHHLLLLPRNLLSLKLNHQLFPDLHSNQYNPWPPTLTTLKLVRIDRTGVRIKDVFMETLPSSLKKLVLIDIYALLKTEQLERLESLRITNSRQDNNKKNIVISSPFLKELNINDPIDIAITELSRKITVLEIDRVEFDDQTVPFLPPFLKKLSIDYNNKLTDNALPKLPSTLSVLFMSNCDQITAVGVQALPGSLTELSLSAKNLESKDIQFLPRKLKSLKLTHGKNLDDNAIPYLPANLRILQIEESEDHPTQLTTACFEKLPQKLRELHLPHQVGFFIEWRSKQFKVKNIENLPKNLTNLTLKCEGGFKDKIKRNGKPDIVLYARFSKILTLKAK